MFFGIDIGGTSIKYGIVDEQLNIVEKHSVPTETVSEAALLEQLCKISVSMAEKFDFSYIGIGAPGYVNNDKGVISGSGNTPFKNTNVRAFVEEKTGKKVVLGNDANCAALGEYLKGEKTVANSVMLTLGTGVGGGLILNRQLYTGTRGVAGELGHMAIVHDGIRCCCGKKGCLEQYASATALIKMTKNEIEHGTSLMASELKDKTETLSGRTVFEYIKKGCTGAEKVLKEYTEYLVIGIENIIDILDPDEIVLAGGITNEKDILMDYINKTFSKRCKIRIASLKSDAGLFGAAMLDYKRQ